MMAATVCLVTEGPAETYFANRLHEEIPVDLVVVVASGSVRRRLARTFRAGGLSAARDVSEERVADLRHRRARRADLDRWFGDRWHALDDDMPRLVTSSSFDPAVADAVRALGDVHLAVHASVLVDMGVVSVCRTALNLHWGLSPYYRGTHCTEWALLRGDVRNIGVTVHELAQSIDGGRIVGQRRATLTAHDTTHSIDAQLTALGTEIIRDSLHILDDGGSLAAVPQDLALGQLTLKRQWTRHLRRQVARLERAGLAASIARPTRPELPIVDGPSRAGSFRDDRSD